MFELTTETLECVSECSLKSQVSESLAVREVQPEARIGVNQL